MKKVLSVYVLLISCLLAFFGTAAAQTTGQCVHECVQKYNPSSADSGADDFRADGFTAEHCVMYCKEGNSDDGCYFWDDGCCSGDYPGTDPDCQLKSWELVMGGSGGRSVQQTIDGGYIIAGSAWVIGEDQNINLIKTDPDGNPQWNKTYGGIHSQYGYSCRQTEDGGYIVAGTTTTAADSDWNMYLLKTDSDGDIVWENTFGGANHEDALSVQQTEDGGFIVLGWTENHYYSGKNIYLLKIDNAGNKVWEKVYDGFFSTKGYSVKQTGDGGYIIAGSISVGYSDVYLLKTDAGGEEIWSNTFGGDNGDEGFSVQVTADGYVITGRTRSYGKNDEDAYLIKTDFDGNLIWEKIFGGAYDDAGFSVHETFDKGFIITGYTWSYGAGKDDLYLIRTDGKGDLLWETTFGGLEYDSGFSVQQTIDGGYVIAGATQSFDPYGTYFIKTDAWGRVE